MEWHGKTAERKAGADSTVRISAETGVLLTHEVREGYCEACSHTTWRRWKLSGLQETRTGEKKKSF